MGAEPTDTIEIFICYAREDEEYRKGLEKQLRVLKRQHLINVWHDREIAPGMEWRQVIDSHLNAAHVILLLISPDFMDSDYCYGIEMIKAIEQHELGEAHVIPIIIRHVYWEKAPFGKLQALPTDGIPVTDRHWHTLDSAFFNVAEGIRQVIELIQQERLRKAEEEQLRQAEQERLRIVEEERLRQADEERLRKAEEERRLKAEQERLRQADEEQLRKAEQERQLKAEQERLRKAEQERLFKTLEERLNLKPSGSDLYSLATTLWTSVQTQIQQRQVTRRDTTTTSKPRALNWDDDFKNDILQKISIGNIPPDYRILKPSNSKVGRQSIFTGIMTVPIWGLAGIDIAFGIVNPDSTTATTWHIVPPLWLTLLCFTLTGLLLGGCVAAYCYWRKKRNVLVLMPEGFILKNKFPPFKYREITYIGITKFLFFFVRLYVIPKDEQQKEYKVNLTDFEAPEEIAQDIINKYTFVRANFDSVNDSLHGEQR